MRGHHEALRRDDKKPAVDMYVAGFPCQMPNVRDAEVVAYDRDSGNIFFDVLEYIRKHRPMIFTWRTCEGLVRADPS